MATSGMTSGKVVGIVKGVEGVVTAINDRGVIRTLKAGDKVFAGETIQTADGANAHIDFSRGGFATMGAGQSLPMDGTVLSQAAEAAKTKPDQPQNGTSDADVEKLQQQIEEALAKGEDPTQLLEAAAAGPGAGGGGGQEGSDFVLVEQLAARGNVTPGFDTGTFGVEFKDPYEYDGREIPGGTFDFEIGTELRDGWFSGYVFEDGQPYRYQGVGGNPQPNNDPGNRDMYAGQIRFTFTPTGTTVVDKVHLSGFDPGTKLYIGDPADPANSVEVFADASGVFSFDQSDFTPGPGTGVFIIPPLDSDGDMTVSVVLDVHVNGGATGQLTGSFDIVVDAVADKPEEAQGEVIGNGVAIGGMLEIDGENATKDRKDGWDETTISKNAGNTEGDFLVTAEVKLSAVFFDMGDGGVSDDSETHTLYVEVPSVGEFGVNVGGQFEPFDIITAPDGKQYYKIPQGLVTWSDPDGLEAGSEKASVECQFRADGSEVDLTGDIELDLTVLARAEETDPTDLESPLDNNDSWSSSILGDTNLQIVIDSVDSTLTVKAGWASEGNDDSQHTTGAYTPNYGQLTGDTNAGGERGNAGVESASTADQNGAPITLSISGSNNAGTTATTADDDVTESITSVTFTLPEGQLLSNGVVLVDGDVISVAGGNVYDVTISGNVVTISLQSGSDDLTSLDGMKLTFRPDVSGTRVNSDADLEFSYEVTVEAHDASGNLVVGTGGAVYSGTGTIVVDAVADRPTDVSIKAEKVAGAGEEIDLTVKVKFNDLTEKGPNETGAAEHKYVVLNLNNADEKGWKVGGGIGNLLTEDQVNALFKKAGGGDKMQDSVVDAVLQPVGGDSTDPQYVLLEVVWNNTASAYEVHWVDVNGNGTLVPNAMVSQNASGEFEIKVPVIAPTTDEDPATVWAKPVTVVDATTLHGEEYDYDNNISVGDAPSVNLQVSGVHSTLKITPTAVYEGSQADKNTGDMSVSAGGKIALSLVPDSATNTNPDALEKIVFQYDNTHGKVFLGTIEIKSGYAIIFTYDKTTDLYTKAVVVDANGNPVDSITVPGQSLEAITSGLKYTPTTGDVSDVDVDIDYLATIVDPTSGATKVITSYGFSIGSGNSTVADIDAIDPSNKTTVDGPTASVVVDAVADKPEVNGSKPTMTDYDGANTAAGNGDTVKITTTEVTFKDYADSSENHYLLIGSKDVALGGNTTADLVLPDQTIILKGPGGTPTLEIKIEGGKVVSIDGETLSPPVSVNVGAITDPNAGTGLAGYDFIKIPVPNEFLESIGGKITADIILKLPEGITTDQTIGLKVGGMAEETETDVVNNEIRTDNNTSYTFGDGSIVINVSNSITAGASVGYEDGWSNQNTVSPTSPVGSNNAVITITVDDSNPLTGNNDHIFGTKTGETGAPIVLEFQFAGGDSNLGTFTYGLNMYSLGDGNLVKVSDGNYKLTIPVIHLPQSADGEDSAEIIYTAVPNDDHNLTNVEITVDTRADTSTDTATQTYTVPEVFVDAVADLPVSVIKDVATYGTNMAAEIGKEFQITIKDVRFGDFEDGSETHSLVIQKAGITANYNDGGTTSDVTGISLDKLGTQTITINGDNDTRQVIVIGADAASSSITAYDKIGNVIGTLTVTDGMYSEMVNGKDGYFKIPVLNEFLSAADGHVIDATVDVKLPAGTSIIKDADLTVKTGAMAEDTESDNYLPGHLGNNQASQLENTNVKVGVVTSNPTVTIKDNVVSENQMPDANKVKAGSNPPVADEGLGAGVLIEIGSLHTGETATVTLTFDLKAAGDIPESVRLGDVMRVEYKGVDYSATQNLDGTWSVKITVDGATGIPQGLIFKPGYNYNSQDIDVKYAITVKDDASAAEKTWQNSDPTGASGTYQNNGLGIVVDSVAQLPNIVDNKVDVNGLKAGYTHVEKGEPVVLSGKVTFYDAADGSEMHYVVVEVNEKVGQLTSITIDGQVVPLSGDMLWRHDGKMFYKIPVDGPGGGATQYDVEVVAKYTPGSNSVDGETVRLGGVSAEDHTKFNHGDNKELTEENNTAVNYIKSAEIYFSNIGGVGISGGGLFENDTPEAHKGLLAKAGGTVISLSETSTSQITNAEFRFDLDEGLLYLDGKPVVIDDNGTWIANPAVDGMAGVDVKFEGGKWVVTFTNDTTDPKTNPDVTDQLLGSGSKLTYVPDDNYSDVDVKLDYKVDFVNPDTGVLGSTGNQSLPLVVDAVAQKPESIKDLPDDIDVNGPSSTPIETSMKVSVNFGAPFDADESEGHYVLVEVMPNMTVVGADVYMLNGKEYWRVKVDVDDIAADGACEVNVKVQFEGDYDLLHALQKYAHDTEMEVGALALEQDDKGQIFTGEDGNGELRIDNNAAFISGGDVEINYNLTGSGTGYDLHVEPVYENNAPYAHLAYRSSESLRDADGDYYKDASGYLTDAGGNKVNPDGSPYTGATGWLIAPDGSLIDGSGKLIDLDGNLVTDADHPTGFPAVGEGGVIELDGQTGGEAYFEFSLAAGQEGYIQIDGGALVKVSATDIVKVDAADIGKVKFYPGINFSDEDVNLTVKGYDSSSNLIDDDDTQIIVDAVAQKPMDMDSSVSYKEAGALPGDPEPLAAGNKDGFGNEGTVKVVLSGEFADSDGSETHYGLMEVTGKYTPDGNFSIIQAPDGKYYYQVELSDTDGDGKWTAEVGVKVNEDAMNGEYNEIKIGTGLLSQEENKGSGGNWELNTDNNLAWTMGDEVTVIHSTVGTTLNVNVKDTYEGDSEGAGGEISLGLTLGQHDALTELSVSYDNTNGDVVSEAGVSLAAYLTNVGETVTIDIKALLTANGIALDDSTAVKGFLDSLDLRFVATGHGDEDSNVSWKATVTDKLSGDTQSYTGSEKLVIDAVANAPTVGAAGFDAAGNTAMVGGGLGEVSVKLTFSDTDSSETHYAILQQSSDIICTGATVNGAPITTGVETFVGDDGKPYYAVRIPDGVANADVIFTIQAKYVDQDVAQSLKVGGVSLDENVGFGADKEITLVNNIDEAGTPVEIRIGTVTTDKVDLVADGNLIEGSAVAEVTLELNATNGVNEKITSVDLVFDQADVPTGLADDVVIGSVWYEGVKVQDITAGDIKKGTAITVSDAAGIDSDAVTVKLDPGYHNSNSLTVKSDATVTDESGETKSGLTGSTTVSISATADAASAVTAADVDLAQSDVIAGHKAQVAVPITATFPDTDGSENHYFLVQVPAEATLNAGTSLTTLPAGCGLSLSDGPVYKLTEAQAAALKVTVGMTFVDDSALKVVAVSEEKANYGDGGKQFAYTSPESVEISTDGVVFNKAPTGKGTDGNLDVVRDQTEVKGNLLKNVTDVDGDTLSISGITSASGAISGNATSGWTVAGTYGSWVIKSDGSYTYTRTAGADKGDTDTLTFTATDGYGGTLPDLTHTINMIEGGNTKATMDAVTDSIALNSASGVKTGTFVFGDAENDKVTLSSITAGTATAVFGSGVWTLETDKGTLTVKDTGVYDSGAGTTTYEYSYSPNGEALGSDVFTIAGVDALGMASNAGSLTITVDPVTFVVDSSGTYDGTGVDGWNLGANITVDAAATNANLSAGIGDDKIDVSGDGNTIHGGAGNDIINVSGDDNIIFGDAGNDSITVSGDGNTIYGGAGSDTITITGSGDNTVYGGAGDDVIDISGNTGSTTIRYTAGDLDGVTTGDHVTGFKFGVGGDVLDISDLLTGSGVGTNEAWLKDGGFLTLENITQTADGKTTVTLGIDVDGTGGGSAVNLGTFVMDGVGPLGGDQAQALFDQLMKNGQIDF